MSYGPDFADQFRRAASYVDRILKGEKPTDLPVQAPTKYQPVTNIKTAKALGMTVPEKLPATAADVIELAGIADMTGPAAGWVAVENDPLQHFCRIVRRCAKYS
jgi:hypothetical protein